MESVTKSQMELRKKAILMEIKREQDRSKQMEMEMDKLKRCMNECVLVQHVCIDVFNCHVAYLIFMKVQSLV